MIKKYFFLFLSMLTSFLGIGQQTAKQIPVQLPTSTKGHTIGFLEYRPRDYGSQSHPLIIYLHGIGERGASGTVLGTDAQSALAVAANELPKLCAAGATMTFTANCQTSSFVVLSPQLYASYGSWQTWYVDEMIAYAKANLKIDTNRIYLTGISLGGGGTWRYASTSTSNASRLAAIAPVCGTCDWADLCNIARTGTPVWAFHAANDGVVGVGCTNSAVAALAACQPPLMAVKTIYPDGDHWIWGRAYDTTHTWQTPNLFEWFLTKHRTPVAPPKPPTGLVANAGPDQSITGTTATLNASGSSGYPGGWAVGWEVVNPPDNNWDVFPGYDKMGVIKTVQKLTPGTWRFVVTVQDGKGAKASDEVVITVR